MGFLIHEFFNTWLLAARPDLPPPLPSPAEKGGGLGREGGGGQAGQPATMYLKTHVLKTKVYLKKHCLFLYARGRAADDPEVQKLVH